MLVLRGAPMVTHDPDLAVDVVAVREHRARVTVRAEVLARIEAGRRRVPDRPGPRARSGRPLALRGVLDDRDALVRMPARSSSTAAICPKRCTGTTAFADPTRSSARSLSMRRYSSSQSTRTGVAPARTTASAVATNVLAGMMTSSPRPISTRAQRELDRVGSVADADTVRDSAELGVLLLERLDLGPKNE